MAIGSSAIGAGPLGAARRFVVVAVAALPSEVFTLGRLLASPGRLRALASTSRQRSLVSQGRVRVGAAGRLAMKLAQAFDPIEVGEIDSFAFDFTRDVGDEDIVAVQWSCQLSSYSKGTDPTPQARVPTDLQPARHSLPVRDANGNLTLKTGFFAFASVGPMPASAAGATYILEATA